ncbi:hypothetical protein BGZ46_003680 [Entomortierella lignicola]|nr:hypothetical protein BGZ46_003680 [Entomortierella lignicola]
MNTKNSWSSPKDPHHLKRRHTRGSTTQSHSSSRSSPTLPFTSFSDSLSSKSHIFRDEDLHRIDLSGGRQLPFTKDNQPAEFYRNSEDMERSFQPNGVPSWFGSLRSFANFTASNSRGAFASSTSSKNISPRSQCRGRSSSIYYAGSLNSDDSDSDCNSETFDEPITEKNGLKENRVRGPRKSWAMLDPSLGGLFSQSYKAVPGSDSEPTSPCSSSASSLDSPALIVEDLTISETPYRDYDSGYEVDYDNVANRTEPEDSKYEPSNTATATIAYSSAPSSTTSAFSIIKSYVPSLPSFQDLNSGSGGATEPNASTKPGAGFWSIRTLSMSLLSSNQYISPNNASEDTYHARSSSPSDGDEVDKPHRDDDEDTSDESAMSSPLSSPSGSSPISYFSSILSSATSTVSSKGSQLISTQVRDNLEQLPVSSKSIKKIGRTD